MLSKLTTKDVAEDFEGLDLLPLGLVRRRHFHHLDQVDVFTNADGSHHGFFGRICPGLCRIMSVDDHFEVRVCRYGRCSDKECKSDS